MISNDTQSQSEHSISQYIADCFLIVLLWRRLKFSIYVHHRPMAARIHILGILIMEIDMDSGSNNVRWAVCTICKVSYMHFLGDDHPAVKCIKRFDVIDEYMLFHQKEYGNGKNKFLRFGLYNKSCNSSSMRMR